MLKVLRTLAIAAAMLLPFAMQAQETLTVHDGTTTKAFVPVYGYYCDNYLRCQIVYPASELSEMAGGTISGMTFYATQSSVSWGSANFVVKMTEVSNTTLSAFANDDMTTVYTGSLSISGGQMTVTFTTPYTYNGDNLLVEIDNTAEGDYSTSTWYGETVTGASVQGYSGTSVNAVSATQRNFIPKTTFGYEATAVACSPVRNLAFVDAQTTSSSLTLSWIDTTNTNATYSVYAVTATDTTLVPGASGITANTYTVTGLNAVTAYTFGVIADCGTDGLSNMRTVSGRTACGTVTLPYTMGFESDEITAYNGSSYMMPFCWDRYNDAPSTSYNYYPYAYTSASHTGSRSLYWIAYSYTTGADTMMAILPAIDPSTDPMSGNQLRFWAKTSSGTLDMYIGTISDPTDASTFDSLGMVTLTSTYNEFEVILSNAAATATRVALMTKKPSSSIYAYIDDVVLEHMPTCVKPQGLAATTTSNSITLTWADAVNTGATYSIMRTTGTGANADTAWFTATATTYTFSNLPANTTYGFEVRAICSATDSSRAATLAGVRTLRDEHAITAFNATGTLVRGTVQLDDATNTAVVPVWYTNSLSSGLTFSWTLSTSAAAFLDTAADGSYTCQVTTSSIKNYLQMNTPVTVRVKAEDRALYTDYTLTLVTEDCVKDRNLVIATERIRYTATWDNPDTTVTTHYFINSATRLGADDLANAQYVTVSNAHTYTVEGLERETKYYAYLKAECDTAWIEDSVTTLALGASDFVTVANGTTTTGYVPIWGYNYDAPQRSQSIYPASMLTELIGKTITGLKYYPTSQLTTWYTGNYTNVTLTVNLAMTTQENLASGWDETPTTVVFTGQIAADGSINFDQPFTYTGGNLLVDFEMPQRANYSSKNFTATSTSAVQSRYAYGSSYSTASGSTAYTLPKMDVTFSMPANPCPEVTAISADSITNTSATINWTASDADYCVGNQIIVSATMLDSAALEAATPVALAANAVSYNATGLTPDQDYFVYIRALCNGTEHPEGTSGWATYQFRTFPTVRTPQIMWTAVTGKHTAIVGVMNTGLELQQPTNYDYIVSTTLLDAAALAAATPTQTGVDTMMVEVANLASATTYYFYFRNVMGTDMSPWSAPDSVTMPAAMPAVVNLGVTNVAHNAMTAYWMRDVDNFADETAWRAAIVLHGTEPTAADWVTVTDTMAANMAFKPFIGLYTDTAYDIYVMPYYADSQTTGDTARLDSVRTATFPSACQTIGEGTSSSYYFFPGYFGWQYDANLYEITQTGSIESIAVNLSSGNSSTGSTLQVLVKVVDGSFAFSSTTTYSSLATDAVEIYNGTGDFGTSLNNTWISFPIATPVTVSEGQQLLVITKGVGCSASGGCSRSVRYTTATNKSWGKHQDSNDPGTDATGSLSSSRPNMQLCYVRTSTCLDVHTVLANNLTDTTIDLMWYPGNEETSWQYVLSNSDSLSAAELEAAAQVINTPNMTLHGLVHDTTYSIYIRPVCSDTETGNWTRRSFETPHVDFYDVNVVVNDENMGTAASVTDVREGTEATLTATANTGFEFYKWTYGDSTSYTNPLTLTVDSNMTVNAYFKHAESTIAAADIVYWVGTGSNSAVVAVNWADTALAWGVNFSGSITVADAMDTIMANDPRFNYTLDNYGYLADIIFAEDGDTLSKVQGSYWESKNNGISDWGMSQPLANGDFEKWAEPAAGIAYDSVYYDGWGWSQFYAYPMTVNAVSAPAPATITVIFAVNDAALGTTDPVPGTYTYGEGDTIYFSAIPTTGNSFVSWVIDYGDGEPDSVGAQYQSGYYFLANTMMSYGITNMTFTANFMAGIPAPDSIVVTYATNNAALGTTNPAPGTYTYQAGDTVFFNAIPTTGNSFVAWIIDYSDGTADTVGAQYQSGYYFLASSMMGDGITSMTFTAYFQAGVPTPDSVAVTYTVNDATMGSINPNGVVMTAVGDTVAAVATANAGFELYGWGYVVTYNGSNIQDTIFETTVTAAAFLIVPQVYADNGVTITITAMFRQHEGINDVTANMNIYSTDNKIIVKGAEGEDIYIYDLNGRTVATKANANETMEFTMANSGVYMVKVGNAPAKRVLVIR